MEGNCPDLTLPPPPFKSREQNRREFFGVYDPPPPLKTREICWIVLYVPKSMNFGSKLFQTSLTTIHLQTEHLNQKHILKGKMK